MEAIFSKSHTHAIGLGAIAGMRSMSALALISDFLSTTPTPALDDSPLHSLQNPTLATGMKLLAAAEMLADKLPHIPDRISAPSLLVRTLSGALVGAASSEAHGKRKLTGALLGGLSAIAASYAFFFLRKKLSETTPLPDTAYALMEDFLVISAGRALLKS